MSIKIKKSYSGEGQDIFVLELFKNENVENFNFLDIGCAEMNTKSNCYAFEEIECEGVFVDQNFYNDVRKNFFQCDIKTDLFDEFLLNIDPNISYISIDVDECSGTALKKILESANDIKFKAMTFEHELCNGNQSLKNESFELLSKKGYLCIFENVHYNNNGNSPFEDWWVDPNYKLPDKFYKIIKNKNEYKDMYWEDIIKLIQN